MSREICGQSFGEAVFGIRSPPVRPKGVIARGVLEKVRHFVEVPGTKRSAKQVAHNVPGSVAESILKIESREIDPADATELSSFPHLSGPAHVKQFELCIP